MSVRRVAPFYSPPTLLLRQAAALGFIMETSGWRVSDRWVSALPTLLKVASGANKFGCFGYAPHPVIEVTARCNLRCLHCHANGGDVGPEPTTEELKKMILNLTTVREFRTLVLTGGEPLLRRDIFDVTRYASHLGFNVIYATNGVLITRDVARRMREAGALGAAISLDSVVPSKHDWFRRVPGSWRRAIDGMRHVVEEGMYLQVNITISRLNIDEMENLVELADKIGAHVILLYTFVPVGRGEESRWLALSRDEFLSVIDRALRLQGKVKLVISPVAAPWYYAYMASRSRLPPEFWSRFVTGCVAARGMFYVKPSGDVWPCPFIPVSAGNLLRQTAAEIWNGPLFRALRDRSRLGEPCRSCRFREVCGGCRARAYLRTGDLFAADPMCPLRQRPEEASVQGGLNNCLR